MRFLFLAPLALLAGCGSGSEFASENAAVPSLDAVSEKPGEWSGLGGLVGRTPADSGLLDSSSISVDLKAKLGRDLEDYRTAMMRAGPLERRGRLLMARAPDA